MTTRMNSQGKAKSVPEGLAIGTSVSLIITVILSALIAHFLNTEKITWIQAGYWIMGMLFSASFMGGICAYISIKRKRFAISVMSGLLYWGAMLFCTALFFGGDFSAVWETAGIITAGTVTAALISIPHRRKSSVRKGSMYR